MASAAAEGEPNVPRESGAEDHTLPRFIHTDTIPTTAIYSADGNSVRSNGRHSAQLMSLPDAVHTLYGSLKECMSLVETLLDNYKQIAVSVEDCADVLTETEQSTTTVDGDGQLTGRGCCGSLHWSIGQVNSRIDEMMSKNSMARYTAALKSKVLDRIVLLYHGAVQLQAATQRVMETRETRDRVRAGQRKRSDWTQKVKRTFSGSSSRDKYYLEKSGSDSQDALIPHPEGTLSCVLAAEESYRVAKEEQGTAIRQFGTLVNTRLGPAFQNFLLAAVVIVGDVAIIWESGQSKEPVKRMTMTSATQPTPCSVSVHARTKGTLHTRTRSGTQIPRSPFIVRTPSTSFAAQASPARPAARVNSLDGTEAVNGPGPVFSSAEKASHEEKDVDVALPAIDGVRDVKEQATSFVESLCRVLDGFCAVATVIHSMSDDMNAAHGSGGGGKEGKRGADVSTSHTENRMSASTPETVAAPAAGSASSPGNSTTTTSITYVDDELLRYMTTAKEQVHKAASGPRCSWYALTMEEEVLQPLRKLACDKRRFASSASGGSVAASLYDALRRIAGGLASGKGSNDGHTTTHNNGGASRSDDARSHSRSVSIEMLRTRQSSGMSTGNSSAHSISAESALKQQAAELERIWAELVHVSAEFYGHLTQTLSDSVDYERESH